MFLFQRPDAPERLREARARVNDLLVGLLVTPERRAP